MFHYLGTEHKIDGLIIHRPPFSGEITCIRRFVAKVLCGISSVDSDILNVRREQASVWLCSASDVKNRAARRGKFRTQVFPDGTGLEVEEAPQRRL
jgi:hypothetical protein